MSFQQAINLKLSPLLTITKPEKAFKRPLQFNEITPDQFITLANQGIAELNKLIEAYNQAEIEQKSNKLLAIYLFQKELSNQFPAKLLAYFDDYRNKIHHDLFQAIQEQFSLLGVPSISEHVIKAKASSKPIDIPNTSSLPEIVANMAPEKADLLLMIFDNWGNSTGDLHLLYKDQEPGSKEFKEFLRSHSIQFLGGYNCKNYQITNTENNKSFVLRIERRLGSVKTIEKNLRADNLEKFFAPIHAERYTSYFHFSKSKTISRVLQVMDFHPEQDLYKLSEQTLPDEIRLDLALTYYSQMAAILEALAADNCAFPDMKNSNWLVTDGRLQITDTKSFAFIDKTTKNLNYRLPENQSIRRLQTTRYSPPELLGNTQTINHSADKIHAFILGKNIYEFLSMEVAKSAETEGTNLDFSAPIFSTPIGKEFQKLICHLVRRNPESRTTIFHAHAFLEKTKLKHAQEKCINCLKPLTTIPLENDEITSFLSTKTQQIKQTKTIEEATAIESELQPLKIEELIKRVDLIKDIEKILQQIKQTQFGDFDVGMQNFIQQKQTLIKTSTNNQELLLLKDNLQNLTQEINNNKAIKSIHFIIDKFRKEADFYTIGMKNKALKIELAMAQIPIEKRLDFHRNADTLKANSVLQVLAAHRHPFRANPVNDDGTINSKKAANSYRFFYKKVEENSSSQGMTHKHTP